MKHRLELSRRGADDLEHVRSRGLLLQQLGEVGRALPQFVEQPRVFDGNHRLCGKISNQCNLLVAKRPNLLPVDGNGADHFIVFEHRNHEESPCPAQFTDGDGRRIAPLVSLLLGVIGNMDHLFGCGGSP